jgi:hypothetical protein
MACIYILLEIKINSQSSYNGPVTGTGSNYVASTVSVSQTTTPSTSKPLNKSSARQLEIMSVLDMDQSLISNKGSRVSLETIWKRYTSITKAISIVSSSDWDSGKKPTDSEIIAIYSSKSVFYDQSKVLQHVRIYPEMIEWLERLDDQADETTSLWGYYKVGYALRDLEKWLEQKQKESRSDRKGKKKADDSPPLAKRSHKKSVGGRK